jgi:4-amino-4-deoxy-L-arabinose transferase-like glycosyltransferase
MDERTRSYRHALSLAALCALAFVAQSWQAPLFDLDEGAFAQATLEMLSGGDWLTTTLDGAARYDKPMLAYWLQALSVRALGVTELAFRLPSMIAACVWAWALYRFVRDDVAHVGDAAAAALFAASSLAGALMVGVVGHAATADALLNLWLALSFFELWRWLSQGRRAALLRLYLWIGLGLLTKGPVAAVLPLLSGLVFCAAYGRLRDARHALLEWRGWLITFAVLAVWLLPLAWQGRLDFVWQFLWQHNVGRVARPAEGHGGPLWYYLIALPLVLLPFSTLLPKALGQARQWRQDPLAGLALIWFGITLVLFSLVSTKLPHYILYGCTPLFVLFGRDGVRLEDRRLLLPGLIFIALLASLPLWLGLIQTKPQRAFEHGVIALARASVDRHYALLALAGAAAAVWSWFARRPLRQRFLTLAFVQAALVWLGLVPLLAEAQQSPVREAARIARASGLPTVVYRTYLPSFSVYRGQATEHRAPQSGELVFLRRDRIAALRREQPDAEFHTVFERGGVSLLRAGHAGDRTTTSSRIPDHEPAS